MAVAFDAFSNVAAGTGTLSWTHTPVGTPRAVRVDIVEAGGTNGVSAVTYGGVAMELVAVNAKTSGEAGTVITYFLGRGIPTGAQTVSVTVSDAVSKRAGATTLTAAANTCWTSADVSIGSDSLANPTSTLALHGKASFVSLALCSGQNAATGITQSTGWTNRLEHSFGTQTAAWYTYNTISTANVACGWTQTADDAVMVALAITEVPLAVDSAACALTETASKAVVFDARTLPILIVESSRIASILTATDSLAVQASDAAAPMKALSATDTQAVAASEVSSLSFTSVQAFVVSDGLAVSLGDGGISVSATVSSSAETVRVGLTETEQIADAQTGALIVHAADSLACIVAESIFSLQVFSPGATQNFAVTDSLKVQLNGSGVAPTLVTASDSVKVVVAEPSDQQAYFSLLDSVGATAQDTASVNTGSSVAFFTASDSLMVVASESTTLVSNTILAVTDSLRLLVVEDVPDAVAVVSATDSLKVVATEPLDQSAQFSVLDSVAVSLSGDVGRITGQLSFLVTDSLAVQASESAAFGACTVGAVDSVRVVASELLTNAASVIASDSAAVRAAEVLTLFNARAVADLTAVQMADSASPIFNNFIDLTASDACTVQLQGEITNLVSFLTQVSTSDTAAVVASDSALYGGATLSTAESLAAQMVDAPSIAVTQGSADTLAIRTIEAGLAIPIVSVNVTTFTDDSFGGIADQAIVDAVMPTAQDSMGVGVGDTVAVTVTQPSAETVAAALLEAMRLDLSGVIREDQACQLIESARIAVTQQATDSGAVKGSESAVMQPGFYFDDSIGVIGAEQTDGYMVVANASPETWNLDVGPEHRRAYACPGRYQLTERRNW